MNLISVTADLSHAASELHECRLLLTRLVLAIERLSPPLQEPEPALSSNGAGTIGTNSYGTNTNANTLFMAESPEEYQARIDSEAALAISLGVAPWSPAFQQAVSEMRNHLVSTRMETDDEGKPVAREGLSEEEADRVVRQAFALARAEENKRE